MVIMTIIVNNENILVNKMGSLNYIDPQYYFSVGVSTALWLVVSVLVVNDFTKLMNSC